jgi:DNA-binding transcriptional MerR regulator
MTGKLYYSIGETAKILNVNTSTIRFWEKEFHIIKPHKNNKGNRLFTASDIENLKLIHKLLKEEGYTIPGAREHLKAKLPEMEKDVKVIETLEKVKEFLEEIRGSLD